MLYPHIKPEASLSPDLTFHFKFPTSHDHPPRSPEDPPTPLYRFGSPTNYHHHHHHPHPHPHPHSHPIPHSHSSYMSYDDEYDDVVPFIPGQLSVSAAERTVRRRSSKACDQCRKSKCKCERSGPNEPCKSCIMLGTPCTFLGPSRKRGPPKGYIDAIEARLHQTEALVGIMLSTRDPRAQSLLRDIAQDPLAKEIISRVDSSPYGVKGRKRTSDLSPASASGSSKKPESPTTDVPKEKDGERLDLTSTHPSNEWQDKVIDMLGAGRTTDPAYVRATPTTEGRPSLRVATYSSDDNARSEDRRERQRRRLGDEDYLYEDINPSLPSPASTSASAPHSAGSAAAAREEQEGACDGGEEEEEEKLLAQAVGELSLNEDQEVRYHGQASGLYLLGVQERCDKRNEGGIWRFPGARVWPALPPVTEDRTDVENDVHTIAESVASSGSPIRRSVERSPVLPKADCDNLAAKYLPPKDEQERLLQLYFTYVHPSFPVVHKKAFWEVWNNGRSTNLYLKRNRRIPPLLLLAMFSIAARYDVPASNPNVLAFPSPSASESSRSSSSTAPLPTDNTTMWAAGEDYFNSAKSLLDTSYASSRSSTCQALLLMGYREIGIGAMALAWTYTGMAIRMAQDLGMHRKADGWRRPGLGKPSEAATGDEEGRIFGDWELGERRRIWFGCVVMDKYVSAYIGRPLMICEKDFDTEFPELTESEEMEDWKSLSVDGHWTTPVPGRVVSCFNKCAELSGILSSIIQAIYAVRPFPTSNTGTLGSPVSRPACRQAETEKQAAILEGVLNKWYLDLPEHLRYDIAVSPERDILANLPPAHVLTLHMQYWCAVLLLHRPFIRRALNKKVRSGSDDPFDSDDLALMNSRKSYELCASAAGHITSIVTAYRDLYPLNRSSVFLCYYVFTASIMHVISISAYPDDPQAHINLRRCLDALTAMRYVWPSAERALELLTGAKTDLTAAPVASVLGSNNSTIRRDVTSAASGNKRKSTLEDEVQDSITIQPTTVNGAFSTSGEYVTPIRSGVGASQVHHSIHRQTSQRELAQAAALARPIQQPSYPTAAQTYAIQPPSLLATDSYSWSESGGISAAPNASPVLTGDESHLRLVGGQLNHEDEAEFNGPLSTSVLPQIYSTGLVDEHNFQSPLATSTHHPSQPQTHLSPTHAHPQPQYHQQYSHASKLASQVHAHSQPQYWSDGSTFSQLGMTADTCGGYNELDMGVGGASEIDLTLQGNPHPHPHQPHPHQHPQQHPQHSHTLTQQIHPNVANLPGMFISAAPYESYGASYR